MTTILALLVVYLLAGLVLAVAVVIFNFAEPREDKPSFNQRWAGFFLLPWAAIVWLVEEDGYPLSDFLTAWFKVVFLGEYLD